MNTEQLLLTLLAVVCMGQCFLSLLVAGTYFMMSTYLAVLRRRLEADLELRTPLPRMGVIAVSEYHQRTQ